MKYKELCNTPLSVFQLGTVQLGMDYGLGDHTAKPSAEYAFSLLNAALAHGVNVLDTANNYGDSERVIGAWLKTLPKEKRPFIITKIGPFDHSSEAALRADIRAQAAGCLQTLGIENLDMLMVHDFEDYEQAPEILREEFTALKSSGVAKSIGISAYSRHDYFAIARSGFDAVQIPLNAFDWGQIDCGGIKAMADAGMAIFARSVYLQGLVFMTEETLDPRMEFCLAPLKRYLSFCEELEMSPAVLALSFALSVEGLTHVVLGCQTLEQLEENCKLIDAVKTLTPAQMERLHDAFKDIDPRVINPGCWFNHT